MNDKINPTDARQGERTNRVRWILALSLILAIVVLSVALYGAN